MSDPNPHYNPNAELDAEQKAAARARREELKANLRLVQTGPLPDPSEETGSSDDLGGGYGAPLPEQPTAPHPSKLTEEEKRAGLAGLAQTREAMRRASELRSQQENPPAEPPEDPDQDPERPF